MKNPLSDFEERRGVEFSKDDEVVMENERAGNVSFAIKWEGAKKQSTLSLMEGNEKVLKGKKNQPDNYPRAVTESDEWTTILAVDCRGLEPMGWNRGVDEFVIESSAGSTFQEDVDLTDDWCEYCEKAEESVGVNNIEWRWSAL